ANITPDKETGIGTWTAEQFVTRFKTYSNPANIAEMGATDVNTIMPWTMFAGMDTSDLRSIYAYLQTVKPIKNHVDHFVAVTEQKK
ncbi:MAG: cytochrome C, partial [Ginsengibacter sp.]